MKYHSYLPSPHSPSAKLNRKIASAHCRQLFIYKYFSPFSYFFSFSPTIYSSSPCHFVCSRLGGKTFSILVEYKRPSFHTWLTISHSPCDFSSSSFKSFIWSKSWPARGKKHTHVKRDLIKKKEKSRPFCTCVDKRIKTHTDGLRLLAIHESHPTECCCYGADRLINLMTKPRRMNPTRVLLIIIIVIVVIVVDIFI